MRAPALPLTVALPGGERGKFDDAQPSLLPPAGEGPGMRVPTLALTLALPHAGEGSFIHRSFQTVCRADA